MEHSVHEDFYYNPIKHGRCFLFGLCQSNALRTGNELFVAVKYLFQKLSKHKQFSWDIRGGGDQIVWDIKVVIPVFLSRMVLQIFH